MLNQFFNIEEVCAHFGANILSFSPIEKHAEQDEQAGNRNYFKIVHLLRLPE